ncbi:MAG: peptidoglycan recognition protein family protein [Azoarcus sp.]|jgi:hypothetical protein|nr:peptidoglycan recognition protein family protein [Azoarcus sp.]
MPVFKYGGSPVKGRLVLTLGQTITLKLSASDRSQNGQYRHYLIACAAGGYVRIKTDANPQQAEQTIEITALSPTLHVSLRAMKPQAGRQFFNLYDIWSAPQPENAQGGLPESAQDVPIVSIMALAKGNGTRPHIVPLNEWRALKPDLERLKTDDMVANSITPFFCIAIHHSGDGGIDTPQGIEKNHIVTRGWEEIGYHFLIAPNGTVYEGRPLKYRGRHIEQNNSGRIGINVLGDFNPGNAIWWMPDLDGDSQPTVQQISSMYSMIAWLETQYAITTIGGHRDFAKSNPTVCPGDYLYPYVPVKGL